MRLLLILLLPLAALATSRSLGPDAPKAAEVRYKAGIELYRAGKYDEAAREFLVAQKLHPDSARLAFNLARSLERASRATEAAKAYELYLSLEPEAKDRAEVEKIVAALRELAEGQLPLLEIGSTPPGLPVLVDGEALSGQTPLSLRIAPGLHRVEVGPPEGRRKVEVTVAAGQPNTVHVSVETEAPAAQAPTPWAWVALGVGAAGVGAGIFFALDASDAKDERDSASTKSEADEAHDRAGTSAALSWVGLGLGAAGLGLGTWLLMREDAPVSASLSPQGVVLQGRF